MNQADKDKKARELINAINERHKKNGWKVTFKFANEYSVDEMIRRIINSHI